MSIRRIVVPESDDHGVAYSDAVLVHAPASLLFLSGVVGHVGDSGEPIVDVPGQTRRIFERLTEVVEGAGGTLESLVEIVTYVVDMGSHLETIRRVRAEFLPADRLPASTVIGVDELLDPAVQVEVRAVAAL